MSLGLRINKLTLKDYYKILEVSKAATPQDIKKSFRQLALRYHPDRTNNDKIAEAKFKEIQEAYGILSSPTRKKEYDYKSEDKNNAATQKTYGRVTPQSILQSLKTLRLKVNFYDEGRIDQKSLYEVLRGHLSSYNIVVLKENKDIKINRLINEEALRVCNLLNFLYAEKVAAQLKIIALGDRATLQNINAFLIRKKRYGVWDKYKVVLVFVVAVVLCLIIYLAAE